MVTQNAKYNKILALHLHFWSYELSDTTWMLPKDVVQPAYSEIHLRQK